MHSMVPTLLRCYQTLYRHFLSWTERQSRLERFIYTSRKPLPSSNHYQPNGEANYQRDRNTSGGIGKVARHHLY